MVDALANEYGWDMEYTLNLPVDVVAQLSHAIMYRKGGKVRRKRYSMAVPAGTLGQKLDAIWGQIDNDD